MSDHRKLPEEWTITVCPACNGIVENGAATHTGDCPNRNDPVFWGVTIHVIPKPRPPLPPVYDEATAAQEARWDAEYGTEKEQADALDPRAEDPR